MPPANSPDPGSPPGNSSTSIPRLAHWRARHGAALALVMGLALSGLAFFALYVREHERATANFTEATESIAETVERCAHHQVDNLYALAALFDTFPEQIDYPAFRNFAHPLVSHCAALLALHWIPRVPGAGRASFEARMQQAFPGFRITAPGPQGRVMPEGPRDEYYPILYVEPLGEYRTALGFDVASRPNRWRALQQARDTGNIATVDLQYLIPYPSDAALQVMFYPVYDPGAEVATVAERRRHLRGAVAAVFRIDEIVAEALREAGNPAVDVYVHQNVDGGRGDLLYAYRAPRPGLQAATRHADVGPLSLSSTFEVAGNTWSVVVAPAGGTDPALRSWRPWSGLGAGLLTTLLLLGYWQASRRHTVRVEQLAAALQREAEEHRRDAEALRQANQRLNALIQASPLPMVAIDRERRVILWNPAAERLYGWRTGEVLGQPLPIVPEAQRAQFEAEIGGGFEGRPMPMGVELQRLRKDGSLVDLRRWMAPFQDAAGRVVGIIGIFEDIGERKRIEQALRLSEARLRTAIQAAGVVVFHQDRDLRYTWCYNPLGLCCENKRNQELYTRPEEAEVMDVLARQVLKHGTGLRREVLLHVDNQEHYFDYTLEPLLDAQGQVEGVIGAAVDITEHRQLQLQLREQAAQLAEADRRKNEFLAVLAHELRNPLAPIANAVEVLRRRTGPPDPVVQWAEGVIGRQIEHLTRLVDDLLDVARITQGRIELKKERVRLADIVARAVDMARPVIDARYHTLTVNLPPEPINLDADPARLVQVLGNLLDNAAKYTPEEGRIALSVEQEGPEAVIRVRDSGKGLLPEMLARVFEPFSNVNHVWTRSHGEGLGLGLSLARKLIEMHGGSIQAASEGLGRGSVFTVRLPLAEHPLARATPAERRRPPAAPRRILVVEDNPDVAESFAVLLRTLGHEVEVAPDGPSALEAAPRFHPEAVFLDIGLPGMDGYEVARRLRAGDQPELPLVALTGYGQEEDRRRARDAGFDQHLLKPVKVEDLERVLNTLCSTA